MRPFLIFLQFQNKDNAGVQYKNLRDFYYFGYRAMTQYKLVVEQPSSINQLYYTNRMISRPWDKAVMIGVIDSK